MNQQSIKREREKDFIDVGNPQTDPDDSLGKTQTKNMLSWESNYLYKILI